VTRPAPARFSTAARPWGARVGLAAWAVGTVVLCAYLLGAHLLTLPKPSADEPRLRAAIARAREAGAEGRWVALHVLYQGCRCSRRVLDALLGRGPAAGYSETIVLVGDGDGDGDERAARARALGFRLEHVAPEALAAAYGVEAAPLLAVASPRGEVRYLGGYGERKQGPVSMGAPELARLAAGGAVGPRPTFGCAVSERLRSAVDPWRVR
jgi:hypothetical protein